MTNLQFWIVMLRTYIFPKRTNVYDEPQTLVVILNLFQDPSNLGQILKQVQDDASNELIPGLLNQTRHQ